MINTAAGAVTGAATGAMSGAVTGAITGVVSPVFRQHYLCFGGVLAKAVHIST